MSSDPKQLQREKTARATSVAVRVSGIHHPGRKEYSDEFYTPDHLVNKLGTFDLDPCAGPKSHASKNWRLPTDGLSRRWHGRVWLNPPYSNIYDWLERFVDHSDGIVLLNSRTETGYFQRLASKADGVLFIMRRVNFETPSGKLSHPPCGSVLVAYGPRNATALADCGIPGLFYRKDLRLPTLDYLVS